MTKRGKQTKEMLDAEISNAIGGAEYFLVSIFTNGSFLKETASALGDAAKACPRLEEKTGGYRQAMVYAVDKDGRSVFVPRSHFPALV